MNSVDHPHGGKTRGGILPKTPWGKLAKGIKTGLKRDKYKPMSTPTKGNR